MKLLTRKLELLTERPRALLDLNLAKVILMFCSEKKNMTTLKN